MLFLIIKRQKAKMFVQTPFYQIVCVLQN